MNIGTMSNNPPAGRVTAKPGTLLAAAAAFWAKISGTDTTGWVQLAGMKDRNALAPRGGVYWDGSSSAKTLATLTNQNIGTDNFSLSFMLKAPTSVSNTIVLSALTSSSSSESVAGAFVVYLNTAGAIDLYIFGSSGSNYRHATSTVNVASVYGGRTVHVAIVRSGAGQPSLYLNGVSVALNADQTAGTPPSDWSVSVTSGYLMTFTAGAAFALSAHSFYNLALAQSDVTEICELNGAVPERFKFGSEANVYASNFSASVDGWTGNRTTLTFGQTIGGQANALQVQNNGNGITGQGAQKSIPLVIGRQFRLSWSTYTPAAEEVTGTALSSGSVSAGVNNTTGAWVPETAEFTATTTGLQITALGTNSGSTAYYGLFGVSAKQIGAVVHLPFDDGFGLQLRDVSSNALHALMASTGVTHIIPTNFCRLRASSNTNGNQQLLGNTSMPANTQVVRVRARSLSGTPTVTLGYTSAGTQVVASVALSTNWKNLTVAATDPTNNNTNSLWANSGTTDTVQWDITFDYVSP